MRTFDTISPANSTIAARNHGHTPGPTLSSPNRRHSVNDPGGGRRGLSGEAYLRMTRNQLQSIAAASVVGMPKKIR